MQDISIKNFEDDISSIREYIEHIRLINNIAVNNRGESEASLQTFIKHLVSFSRSKKIFEYKSIIVSLYGILEKYINIWIREHIDKIPNLILKYDSLPEKLKKNNFALSIKLISLIAENRFAKYDPLNKEEILFRLNDCLKSTDDYSLNSEAFMPLSGNLKHSKIVEAFLCFRYLIIGET